MARTNGAAMTLAVMAMALPASLISTSGIDDPVAIHGLSITVAVVLIVIYFLTLIFHSPPIAISLILFMLRAMV
jgi:Ca2+:H+ antiporter